MQREFAPVEPHFAKTPLLNALVNFCIRAFPINPKDYCRLEINTHLFRVTCDSKQMGLATPEGIHRDGHSFVSQHLIQRHNVLGGISGIYKNGKEPLFHKQLSNFMDTILVLDDKVMHDVSPIYPNNSKLSGFRDMLIIDYNYV